MRKIIIVFFVFAILSCSSDDGPGLDLDLLHGQWYNVGLCQAQNSLLFNSNGTFIRFSSGAIDCTDPVPDTVRTEGTYRVQNRIYTVTVTNSEVVIEGNNTSTPEFIDIDPVSEIVELTETSLRFNIYVIGNDGVREILAQPAYER